MEFIDFVDKKDRPLGSASMDEIYEKLLIHRIVHILIFNDQGKMALQMRSQHKSFCPGHWSTAVGGHVQSGETYEQAAQREMNEEIGLDLPIIFLRKDLYKDKNRKGLKKFLGVFKCTHNGPFDINKEEVDDVQFFTIDKIREMIKAGEKFHPELLFLFDQEYRILEPRIPHKHFYKEEVANSVVHGIGVGLSIAALVLLVVFAALQGDAWRVVSFSIFGGALVLLYLASTLYHGFRNPRLKYIFKVFDYAFIYILIAGTYTPFTLVSIRGGWGWSIFGVIWGLALFGIIGQGIFGDRFRRISVFVYLFMGWLILLAIGPLARSLTGLGLMWLFLGGSLYTIGTIFYGLRKVPYAHTIWHVFVLAASVCHFFGILFYVLPK